MPISNDLKINRVGKKGEVPNRAVQFYLQAGAYNVMALDSSYFSNSYQSWNIERGLFWGQEKAVNLTGFGPRSHAWSLTVAPTYQNGGFSPC